MYQQTHHIVTLTTVRVKRFQSTALCSLHEMHSYSNEDNQKDESLMLRPHNLYIHLWTD